MSKIPFTVSARTARLIGRENIATSRGAIIELVKNGYDADSPLCIIYFDNKYSILHNEITKDFFYTLLSANISEELLNKVYSLDDSDESYHVQENVDEDIKQQLKKELNQLSSLYIIDAGDGMTSCIIKNHWMTIGTDNKAIDIFTKSGRIKAGAKGIGRFALDKLGNKCEMFTIFNPTVNKDFDENDKNTVIHGYHWSVNWEDFEGNSKTISDVGAELNVIKSTYLRDEIIQHIPNLDLSRFSDCADFSHGTMLKITGLRDNWDDYSVEQVYSDLKILIPPKESNAFQIYLFSSLKEDEYGEIVSSICDDFDYKIVAKADKTQNIILSIYRQEYDFGLIPSEFFEREAMKLFPYRKSEFEKGLWEKSITFAELVPGFNNIDEHDIFKQIGEFQFTFYYLKKTYSTDDANRFFYKNFHSHERKYWLEKFGGIKLFRDNFRVRPYGEPKDAAFDWLGLGSRKSSSPAGIAKKEGGYKVEPENIAGTIMISRLTNLNFDDKSSREGLQENAVFRLFKMIITGIINVFEVDRAYIAREMAIYDDTRFAAVRNRLAAEEMAKKIIEDNRAKQQRGEKFDDADSKVLILAELHHQKDEIIEELKEEQKLLRSLASSGIVLASLSHDLNRLQSNLGSRIDILKELILRKINESDCLNEKRINNPFVYIEQMKEQDLKFRNWLSFSLNSLKKDKRKRKQLFLKSYFEKFKDDWSRILSERGVNLDISKVNDIDLRVFEIDIDSIFHNLIINSLDAFLISKSNRKREINITVSDTDKEIVMDYYDTGPGLSKDIDEPEKIFQPLYTTKRIPDSGEECGTGLGMWIIKSIVNENDGKVQLLHPEYGFGLRISIPRKYLKVD